MDIKVLKNGIFGSNTYIVSSNLECAIIDCGNKPQDILEIVKSNSLSPKYIILTHGHIDHIFYAGQIKADTGVPLCLHKDELPVYSNPNHNGYNQFGFNYETQIPTPDTLLKHGDKLPLGDEVIEIIHTPGHSPGGVCVLIKDSLFSGDTLFQSGIGRSDLYGGDGRELTDSIKSRLYSLDDSIKVYPGHGTETTIGYEKKNNPFV